MTPSQSYLHQGSTFFVVGSHAAKAGHLRVILSRRRSYGYALFNVILGQTACWYRTRRDALARIEELKTRGAL